MTAIRLLLAALALLAVLGSQVTAATAATAATVNCSSFPSQAAAQAAYRADPAGLANLDADHDGIACEDNPAPYDLKPVSLPGATPTPASTPTPTGSGPATVNCSSFPSQAAAQAAYRANPVGLSNLDADHDGIACEDNPAPYDRTPVLSASSTPTPAASNTATVNCSSFPSQAAAQAAYRADPVGLAKLDADHDGIACESNPAPFDRTPVRLPASASNGLPSPPVTGDGSSLAGPAVNPASAALAAVMLLGLLAAAALAASRARRAAPASAERRH
jgi:hypothetical protein